MSRIEYSLPFDSRAFRRTHMDLDAHETVANFHRLLRSSTPSSTPKRGAKIFLARRGCWVELEGKRDGFFLKTPKRKKSLRINTLPLKKTKKFLTLKTSFEHGATVSNSFVCEYTRTQTVKQSISARLSPRHLYS